MAGSPPRFSATPGEERVMARPCRVGRLARETTGECPQDQDKRRAAPPTTKNGRRVMGHEGWKIVGAGGRLLYAAAYRGAGPMRPRGHRKEELAMPARTVRGPHRTLLTVEQLEARDLMSVAVSVVVPGGHHLRHRHHHRLGGVSVQVHVGPGVF